MREPAALLQCERERVDGDLPARMWKAKRYVPISCLAKASKSSSRFDLPTKVEIMYLAIYPLFVSTAI